MLESKRPGCVEALGTGQQGEGGVMLRRRVKAGQGIDLQSLFEASLREELQRELRKVLREAVLAPADAEWFAEHLCRFAVRAAKGDIHKLVRVTCEEREVILCGQSGSLKLVWSGLWRIEGKPRGMQAMIDTLIDTLIAG